MRRPWIGASAEIQLVGPSLGRGRRRDRRRYVFVPATDSLIEACTADELLESLRAGEPMTPNANAASASPTGRGLFSGYVGAASQPLETGTAPEGAEPAEHYFRAETAPH